MPCGSASSSRSSRRGPARTGRGCRGRAHTERSSTRITHDSPNIVGSVDTRRSTGLAADRRARCGRPAAAASRRCRDRHDLDARDQRDREVRRRRLELEQHAVDAVADLEVVLERLEVDVRRLVADRLVEDVVQQLDDRRRRGHRRLVLEVELAALAGDSSGDELLAAASFVLRTGILLGRTCRSQGFQRSAVSSATTPFDLEPGRREPMSCSTETAFNGSASATVSAVPSSRRPAAHRTRARRRVHLRDRGRLRRLGFEVDEVSPPARRAPARGRPARCAELDQDLTDAPALLALGPQRLLDHALVDEPSLLQDLAEQSRALPLVTQAPPIRRVSIALAVERSAPARPPWSMRPAAVEIEQRVVQQHHALAAAGLDHRRDLEGLASCGCGSRSPGC